MITTWDSAQQAFVTRPETRQERAARLAKGAAWRRRRILKMFSEMAVCTKAGEILEDLCTRGHPLPIHYDLHFVHPNPGGCRPITLTKRYTLKDAMDCKRTFGSTLCSSGMLRVGRSAAIPPHFVVEIRFPHLKGGR